MKYKIQIASYLYSYTKDVAIQILLKVFTYFYFDFNYTSYTTTQHTSVIMLFQ